MGNFLIKILHFYVTLVMFFELAWISNRFPGSTPLHLAARGGSLDCIRELLAWGADRLHRDASGYVFFLSILIFSRMLMLVKLSYSC